MGSRPLALHCTTSQHEKAVSSSLGWPECNANIRTHFWPHNKRLLLCCSWSCPRRQICQSVEAVNVVEFFQMSRLNNIDGFPIFSCSVKAAKTYYAARTNIHQKSSSVTHERVNVLHNLEYKLIHHLVWRKSGSRLWSASGTSLDYDLYSVTGAIKSP